MWQFVRCQIKIWLNLTRVALFPIRPCLPSPHHIASNHSQIARHFSNWLFILILINIIIKIFHLLFASSHSAWFNMSSSSCFFFNSFRFVHSSFVCESYHMTMKSRANDADAARSVFWTGFSFVFNAYTH